MASASHPAILALALRCDRRAPRLARRALEGALDVAALLDDARLVASELVNNAVLHSGCKPDDIMRVMVARDDEFLIISVHVPSPAPVEPADDLENRTLGLRVVQHLADRWGTEHPDGRGVWAACRLTRHSPAGPASPRLRV